MRLYALSAREEMEYQSLGHKGQTFGLAVHRAVHYYRLAMSYRDMARRDP